MKNHITNFDITVTDKIAKVTFLAYTDDVTYFKDETGVNIIMVGNDNIPCRPFTHNYLIGEKLEISFDYKPDNTNNQKAARAKSPKIVLFP